MNLEMIKNNQSTGVNEYQIIQMRDQFANEYSNEKGWDKNNLSFEQIMEIRSNPQWKNPHLMLS